MVPGNVKKSMIHLYPDLESSNWDVQMEIYIRVSANMISEKVLSPRNSATVSDQVDLADHRETLNTAIRLSIKTANFWIISGELLHLRNRYVR